jgi:hypothetical protein
MRGGKKIKNIGLAKVSAWLPFLFSKFCLSLVLCQNGLLKSGILQITDIQREGVYIPLPYCHRDMILENAWVSNFQKDLEWSFRNRLMVSCGQNAMSSPVGFLYLCCPKGD